LAGNRWRERFTDAGLSERHVARWLPGALSLADRRAPLRLQRAKGAQRWSEDIFAKLAGGEQEGSAEYVGLLLPQMVLGGAERASPVEVSMQEEMTESRSVRQFSNLSAITASASPLDADRLSNPVGDGAERRQPNTDQG
jgi:hypothetical protein